MQANYQAPNNRAVTVIHGTTPSLLPSGAIEGFTNVHIATVRIYSSDQSHSCHSSENALLLSPGMCP